MSRVGKTNHKNHRVAVLIVDGFDKSGYWGRYDRSEVFDYPWIDLCLRQIERHSKGWDYEVIVFDNSHLKLHRQLMQQYSRVRVIPGDRVAAVGRMVDRVPLKFVRRTMERPHAKALDYLASEVAHDAGYIVTLDTDSFPIRSDWLDVLVSACEDGAALTGVYRDEMAPTIRPFIHVSGLCLRPADLRALNVSFGRKLGQDIGQNITEALAGMGEKIAPLHRSNMINFHFLMGGIYGDVIYHHGAGSRKAKFWTSTDLETDERVRLALRDAAFQDVDHLMAVLQGGVANDLDLAPIDDDRITSNDDEQ